MSNKNRIKIKAKWGGKDARNRTRRAAKRRVARKNEMRRDHNRKQGDYKRKKAEYNE